MLVDLDTPSERCRGAEVLTYPDGSGWAATCSACGARFWDRTATYAARRIRHLVDLSPTERQTLRALEGLL